MCSCRPIRVGLLLCIFQSDFVTSQHSIFSKSYSFSARPIHYSKRMCMLVRGGDDHADGLYSSDVGEEGAITDIIDLDDEDDDKNTVKKDTSFVSTDLPPPPPLDESDEPLLANSSSPQQNLLVPPPLDDGTDEIFTKDSSEENEESLLNFTFYNDMIVSSFDNEMSRLRQEIEFTFDEDMEQLRQQMLELRRRKEEREAAERSRLEEIERERLAMEERRKEAERKARLEKNEIERKDRKEREKRVREMELDLEEAEYLMDCMDSYDELDESDLGEIDLSCNELGNLEEYPSRINEPENEVYDRLNRAYRAKSVSDHSSEATDKVSTPKKIAHQTTKVENHCSPDLQTSVDTPKTDELAKNKTGSAILLADGYKNQNLASLNKDSEQEMERQRSLSDDDDTESHKLSQSRSLVSVQQENQINTANTFGTLRRTIIISFIVALITSTMVTVLSILIQTKLLESIMKGLTFKKR